MVSFFIAGSWEKDNALGAPQKNICPFLLCQSLSFIITKESAYWTLRSPSISARVSNWALQCKDLSTSLSWASWKVFTALRNCTIDLVYFAGNTQRWDFVVSPVVKSLTDQTVSSILSRLDFQTCLHFAFFQSVDKIG